MFHGINVTFVGINHLIGGMQRNAIFPAHSQTHLLAQQAHMARLQQAQRHNHGQVTTYIQSIKPVHKINKQDKIPDVSKGTL